MDGTEAVLRRKANEDKEGSSEMDLGTDQQQKAVQAASSGQVRVRLNGPFAECPKNFDVSDDLMTRLQPLPLPESVSFRRGECAYWFSNRQMSNAGTPLTLTNILCTVDCVFIFSENGMISR